MRKKDEDKNQVERRQYVRIEKNFILHYHDKNIPSVKLKASQLRNISKGGMCLITEKGYEPNTILIIELNTQYIAENTQFECLVLESHEKVKNIIYETRVKYETVSPQAQILLDKLEEHYKNQIGENNPHE